MARPTIKLQRIDLSTIDNKRRLIAQIGTLTGIYEVEICPRRNMRSNAQNAWYWSCIAPALAEYLSAQDYEITTAEEAHEFLRARFLAVTVANKQTGVAIGRRVRSTTELTTEQFSDYCERCRTWMADFFGIIVEDPDPNYSSSVAKASVAD